MAETKSEMICNQALEKMAGRNDVFGTVLCVEKGDNRISWIGAKGKIRKDDRYFITSVTKICVTVIILKLRSENRIRLEEKICNFLPGYLIDGLHMYKGKDYTREITVSHFLSNTSGIPDYLSIKQANGKTADYNLFKTGKDEAWPFDKVMEAVKDIKPGFKPGQTLSR